MPFVVSYTTLTGTLVQVVKSDTAATVTMLLGQSPFTRPLGAVTRTVLPRSSLPM